MATKPQDPKTVTIYGRLSFPTWTAEEAYARSQKGDYPFKSVEESNPSFNLVVTDVQDQKFRKHVTDVFLPYCVSQHTKGEKRDVLNKAEVKALIDGINGPLGEQTFNTPFKEVGEQTLELVPDATAVIKAIGPKGVTIEQKAVVNSEDELKIPDPDILAYPVIKPISATVFQMYPGAFVAATLNLYAYHNGKHPGFSAGASVAVFKTDGERFGGGTAVDEDSIFLD